LITMPYSDQFVALCLVLARYDLTTSLATLIDRHATADRDLLPFGPRDRHNFQYLLTHLPERAGASLRAVLLSSEELHAISLGDVVRLMLDYDFARAGDTDVGWYKGRSGEARIRDEKLALQSLLASADARDPQKVREVVDAIYRGERAHVRIVR